MSSRTVRFVRPRALVLLAALTALGVLAPLAPAHSAQAAVTFTVNLTEDQDDFDLGDGVCDAARFAAGPQCALRAAIQQANASPGRDTIAFAVPVPGLKTIRPLFELPAITQAVTIDGYTQPGAQRNTLATGGTNAVLKIELDGNTASTAGTSLVQGLQIAAPNTVVRGLAINRFSANGVVILAGGGAQVEGCFLGASANGLVDRGNGANGMVVGLAVDRAVIGGSAPAARNLISGNNGDGVLFFLARATETRIEGNLIGTDKTGTAALGNGETGVSISHSNGHTLGGNTAEAANTIAFNGGDGIEIFGGDSAGNRVLRNAIFANGGEGVDLNPENGPTPNDPGDADTGPNNRQNFPVLTAASTSGGTTTITGRFNSTPNRVFVLRFFSNPTGSEGKVFRGQRNVITDAGGNVAFTFAAISPIPTGHTVTATATSEGGDNSEFSVPTVAE